MHADTGVAHVDLIDAMDLLQNDSSTTVCLDTAHGGDQLSKQDCRLWRLSPAHIANAHVDGCTIEGGHARKVGI